MIGNDIIDLNAVSAASINRRQRFLDKIFVDSEQAFLYNQLDIDKWIWLLWSMKESTWKAHYRNSCTRKFNPKLMTCKVQDFSIEGNFISGVVVVENTHYNTLSLLKSDFIHTIANSNSSKISFDFFSVDSENSNNQSSKVRMEVCKSVSNFLNQPLTDIKIEQNENGVPLVIINGVDSNIQLSISHHGQFGAYAICYERNSSN
jgi:phosphopantetheinyl transferase (holo-ACP synthase)